MVTRRRSGSLPLREAEALARGPSAGFPGVILGAGPDEFLRERLTRAFRAGAMAEGSEFQRLEGDALDPETLAGALATLSLFGGARRIWIREGAKMGSPVEETLLAWAQEPGEGVALLLTTARETNELKFLEALAGVATVVPCRVRGGEGLEWARAIAEEEGVRLPAGTVESIFRSSPDLISFRTEIRKLGAHADAEGKVPASALDALREVRTGGSVERWAQAVLGGTAAEARLETEALTREGVGGTSAMWALAERALAALEPQAFYYRRSSTPAVRLQPAKARAVLDQIYQADRALKGGEIRDADLVSTLVQTVRRAIRG